MNLLFWVENHCEWTPTKDIYQPCYRALDIRIAEHATRLDSPEKCHLIATQVIPSKGDIWAELAITVCYMIVFADVVGWYCTLDMFFLICHSSGFPTIIVRSVHVPSFVFFPFNSQSTCILLQYTCYSAMHLNDFKQFIAFSTYFQWSSEMCSRIWSWVYGHLRSETFWCRL